MTDEEFPIPPEGNRALDGLTLLSKKWAPHILLILQYHGSQGFNELLDALPDISSKVLSDTLDTLQENGLVERRVVNESPLRVKYDRTEAGREMEPIFASIAEWVELYRETAPEAVLLADSDRRITGMYRKWIADQYTVRRAHDSEELDEQFDDDTAVLFLDIDFPGIDPFELLSDFERECRTTLVVGDRPELDVLSIDCDDVIRKPVVRDTALEKIREQLSRRDESATERERASLRARHELFESIYPQSQLEANDIYQTQRSRLEELEEEIRE